MSHRLLTPGLEGPNGNPLWWRVRGGRDDSKCPCSPLSISTGSVAGVPCARSPPAHTRLPCGEALLHCAPSRAGGRQHVKAVTCSPLRKNVFSRRQVAREKRAPQEMSPTQRRQSPSKKDTATLNAQSSPCEMFRLPGDFPP